MAVANQEKRNKEAAESNKKTIGQLSEQAHRQYEYYNSSIQQNLAANTGSLSKFNTASNSNNNVSVSATTANANKNATITRSMSNTNSNNNSSSRSTSNTGSRSSVSSSITLPVRCNAAPVIPIRFFSSSPRSNSTTNSNHSNSIAATSRAIEVAITPPSKQMECITLSQKNYQRFSTHQNGPIMSATSPGTYCRDVGSNTPFVKIRGR